MKEISDVFFEDKGGFTDTIVNFKSKDNPLAITMIFYGVTLLGAAFFPEIKNEVMEYSDPYSFSTYSVLIPFLSTKLIQNVLYFDRLVDRFHKKIV